MKPVSRHLVLLVLMLATSGVAVALKPSERLADRGPRFSLEAVVPEQFGDWTIDSLTRPLAVSGDVQAKLDAIYDQLLARTYVNRHGQRVMLSIAYGGDQSSDRSQVHRPEICYAAQGFQLSGSLEKQLAIGERRLPVRRLTATQGERIEPITYWVTVGEHVTLPGIGRKLLQMRYGMAGQIPDGVLVRVSSVDDENTSAYALQDMFIQDLLAAIKPEHRVRLVGRTEH